MFHSFVYYCFALLPNPLLTNVGRVTSVHGERVVFLKQLETEAALVHEQAVVVQCPVLIAALTVTAECDHFELVAEARLAFRVVQAALVLSYLVCLTHHPILRTQTNTSNSYHLVLMLCLLFLYLIAALAVTLVTDDIRAGLVVLRINAVRSSLASNL